MERPMLLNALRGLALTAALLLGGCAYGVHELQQRHVSRRAQVVGDHRAVSECAARRFQESPSSSFMPTPGTYLWQRRESPDGRTITLVGWMTVAQQAQVAVDFQQRGDVVVIETRRMFGLAPSHGERSVWPLIEACVGRKLGVEPPPR